MDRMKNKKPTKAQLEKLILTASNKTEKRSRLIGSYSGPSPDGGKEEALAAVLAAILRDRKDRQSSRW